MTKNRVQTNGRDLDSWLGTRPLFETLFWENDLGPADRRQVVAHTVGAIAQYRARQVHFAAAEMVDHTLFGVLCRGRVPPIGMTKFLGLGDRAWYQMTDWDAAQ